METALNRKSPGNSSAKQKRRSGGQGREPSPLQTSKQARISKFFNQKSPKAKLARSKGGTGSGEPGGEKEKESEVNNENIQGAYGPLLGDEGGSEDHPPDDTGAQQTPEALIGVPKESGRRSR